jgi:competence protein ComEC
MATGPFAMQHFNRVAVWGLPANLAVAPLSSFVIMPFLAWARRWSLSGWADPFLTVAGWGIAAMMWIADGFASAGGAQRVVASGPPFTLALAFVGLMLLCLWRGRLRWLGAPLALAVALWPRPAPPDVWIAPDGTTAAVRQGREAVLLRPDARRFGAELWGRRRGLIVPDSAAPSPLYACDRRSCAPTAARPWPWPCRGARPRRTPTAWRRCAPRPRSSCCGAPRRSRRRPAATASCSTPTTSPAGGAAELYRRGGEWWIVWAQPLRGVRPWTARCGTIGC